MKAQNKEIKQKREKYAREHAERKEAKKAKQDMRIKKNRSKENLFEPLIIKNNLYIPYWHVMATPRDLSFYLKGGGSKREDTATTDLSEANTKS